MEAFAVLMKRVLQGHLKTDVKIRACFEHEPKVEVAVDKLTDKDEQIKLNRCPETVCVGVEYVSNLAVTETY